MNAVDEAIDLLLRAGAERYGDEDVSQLAHALQCAHQAEREGADGALVAAALLHDIGHLVGDGDEGLAERGIDAMHERIGADWVAARFSGAVAEPVRLHVDAKRYLCTREDGYFARLSPASVRSLAVQGGPYSEVEADGFAARPHAGDAVRLRRWDEAAKDPGALTPGLEHYRPLLQAHLRDG